METTLDEYGYFPKDFDFHTVTEWDDFQENFYKNLIKEAKNCNQNNDSLFFDTDVELWNFTENHKETSNGKGTFKMFLDSFVFETKEKTITIPLSEIPEVSIHGKKTLVFSAIGNLHYELKSEKLINVRKYLSCFYNIKNT
jgi:hypothetical protein